MQLSYGKKEQHGGSTEERVSHSSVCSDRGRKWVREGMEDDGRRGKSNSGEGQAGAGPFSYSVSHGTACD